MEEYGILIESLKEKILKDSDENILIQSLIKSTGALPVYLDLHLVYSIDSELKGFLHYDDGVLVEENVDIKTMHFIKAMAAKKYPQLKGLHPVRDDNSVDCPYCAAGTMTEQAREAGLNIVCDCANLGWLPEL